MTEQGPQSTPERGSDETAGPGFGTAVLSAVLKMTISQLFIFKGASRTSKH